ADRGAHRLPHQTLVPACCRHEKGAGAYASRARLDGSADPCFLRPASCCVQTQNMPKTTAVRKAKDTMAASTLSLVRSSIAASFAGNDRRFGASCPAPTQESRWSSAV